MIFTPDDSLVSRYGNRVFALRPVVQCITNIVTVNDCANALLAVGASPTMAHHPEEMADFAAITDALVLNMGATESIEAMRIAGKAASSLGHPIIIDPVGCAGSPWRRSVCLSLINEAHPTVIRGNVSEIRALLTDKNSGRGVDDRSPESIPVPELCAALSEKTGAIVIASGATDYISDGKRVLAVHGGSPLMARITGTGCMLSALLGAFLAAE
ncbi:MAG: hydroxyethylthiazole kinase, partial [Clostridium sp.]|nr:hydroxyethylthiazole kinase [Clostridium sp.]